MVLVESRHLRIKIKKHILQRLFPNRRHLYPQEFSLYLSPFSADLLKQHYHINHLDIHLCGLKSYYCIWYNRVTSYDRFKREIVYMQQYFGIVSVIVQC